MKGFFWAKVKTLAAVAAVTLMAVGGGTMAVRAAGPAAAPNLAVEKTPSGSAADVVSLDAKSFWRYHMTWRTQQVKLSSGEIRYGRFLDKNKWIEETQVDRTSSPPGGWTTPDFDDSAWGRERGPFGELRIKDSTHWPATLAEIRLRGTFEVPDPSVAMKLDVSFSGGVVVYVNGKEAGRAGLPAGALAPDALADAYPDEAWMSPEGKLLTRSYDNGELFKKRLRVLSFAIPAAALRKGRNVLAVEIRRAPVNEIQFKGVSKGDTWHACWFPVGLDSIHLSGGNSKPASSDGFRIWNADSLHRVRATDSGDAGEVLWPIVLAGARNGAFSGQVIIGFPGPLAGVKAQATDLAGDKGGVIPVSAVQVRYALFDGEEGDGFFEGLSETPPAQTPKGKDGSSVQPVWVTVHVPKDAKPGVYTGKLIISGPKSTEVPVKISVADWAIPDPLDFVTVLDLVQSPETLADAYKVPMWSEAHWKLMYRSFELMSRLGSKAVYVSLVRRTEFGNKHGMVRWIKKGDGWEPDLGIAEKYIAMAVNRLGKVPVVVLNLWHSETGGQYFGNADQVTGNVGFPFTEVNPATGELTEANGPVWGDPKIVELLKPAVDGLREILRKHGIEKSLMVGIATDLRPRQDAVDAIRKIAPDAKWVVATHPYTDKIGGVDVGYLAHVWGITCTPNPTKKQDFGDSRAYGWSNPHLTTCFPRYGCWIVGNSLNIFSPLAAYRAVMEAAITSPGKIANFPPDGRLRGLGMRGVGRLGADFWDVLGGAGRKSGYYELYVKKGDHAVNLRWSVYYLFSRGPDGAIPSTRFEQMREGIQEAEARVVIEKAILGGKLDAATAKKCQDMLDERAMAILWAREGSMYSEAGWLWYVGSGWRDRNARLYALAAEVSGKMGGK
ncbi:MAG: glycoside hydrolase domain-containing protein [Planctomycetota bacterium]